MHARGVLVWVCLTAVLTLACATARVREGYADSFVYAAREAPMGPTPVHREAGFGSEAQVADEMRSVTGTQARDRFGQTALFAAVACGETKVVRELLRRGEDPNARNLRGFTPLHVAAASPRDPSSVVRTLVSAGADVAASTADGTTPLHLAAARGNAGLVNRLLRAKASPTLPDVTGVTSLHEAVRRGHDRIVKRLLQAGARPDAATAHGATALHLAAVDDHV